MSIHGPQLVFPYVYTEKGNPLDTPIDLAVGFMRIADKCNVGEKIINFTRLAWPIILVQGTVNSHIVIDDLGIRKLELNLVNSPRQATVGHILRNIENRTYPEMLDRILGVLSCTEEGRQLELLENESYEPYTSYTLKGLMSPDILGDIARMYPYIKEVPISEYSVPESVFTFEQAMDIAGAYKKLIENIRGTKVRWENVRNLIKKEFDEWIIILNAKIKDAEMRYKSTISKEEESITEEDVKEELKKERDRLDRWALQEKKAVLEKIGSLFAPIERKLEEFAKKNAVFTNIDGFKLLNVEKAVNMAKEHITEIENLIEYLKERKENAQRLLNEYIERIAEIDKTAFKNYKKKELELNTKLQQRNARIMNVKEANERYIAELKSVIDMLNVKYKEIEDLIERKKKECDENIATLLKWSISDDITSLNMLIIRVFIPVYMGTVEDEIGDEKLLFAFPSVIGNGTVRVLGDGFGRLEKDVEETVEDDMKIRSNLEFTADNGNFLGEEGFIKRISNGFSYLVNGNYIDSEKADKYLGILSDIK